MARASLAPDVVEPYLRKPVPQECWASINSWRRRFAAGEVSAFGVPLWEAVEMAWDTADGAGHSTESRFIEHAFPKRGATGETSVLEVSVNTLG